MSALLSALFNRLPIGWLQLKHNKTRLAAALAGVAFANILILMQLGFLGALTKSIVLPYGYMQADILISATDANTLSDGSNVARQRMFQALAVPGVADAQPLWLGRLDIDLDGGEQLALTTYGFDPLRPAFRFPETTVSPETLRLPDTVLLDRKTRGLPKPMAERLAAGQSVRLEANDRTIDIAGSFRLGGGFESDGYMLVSDQTFLRLFPKRSSGAPSHILVTVAAGEEPETVAARLNQALPDDVLVRTVDAAAAADQKYQTTQRPVGVVLGFGVIIGVLVGIIIVYQVLSTDVADHLGEYATLKAIGYRQRFFLSIVIEEALILAVLGFIPGIIAAFGLYSVVAAATGLPMGMTGTRAVAVFAGTIIMCSISGALATRRLAAADPADLF